MHRLDGVHDDAGRAGAGEGGRKLLGDVQVLPDAGDDDLAAFVEGFEDEAGGGVEVVAERGLGGAEALDLDVDDFPRS